MSWAGELPRLSDGTLIARLNPQPITLAEALHLSDTVTADMHLLQVLVGAESMRLIEQLVVLYNPALTADLLEGLRAAETLTGRTNPDAVVLSELMHLVDTVSPRLNPQPILVPAENMLLADGPVAPRLNPQPIGLTSEVLKLSETVTAVRV